MSKNIERISSRWGNSGMSSQTQMSEFIVNRREGLENHYNYNVSHYLSFCSGLCRNEDLHRHVIIVFLPK